MSNAYIVKLSNGAEVKTFSSSWMLAGVEACRKYRADNPDYKGPLAIADVAPDGVTDDIVEILDIDPHEGDRGEAKRGGQL